MTLRSVHCQLDQNRLSCSGVNNWVEISERLLNVNVNQTNNKCLLCNAKSEMVNFPTSFFGGSSSIIHLSKIPLCICVSISRRFPLALVTEVLIRFRDPSDQPYGLLDCPLQMMTAGVLCSFPTGTSKKAWYLLACQVPKTTRTKY